MVSTVSIVLVSFVLQLRSEDLRCGLIAGRIEHVASGRQQAIDNLEQVVDFCRKTTVADPTVPAPRCRGANQEGEPT